MNVVDTERTSHREKQLEGKVEYLTRLLQDQKREQNTIQDEALLQEMADKLKAQENYIKVLEDATKGTH